MFIPIRSAWRGHAKSYYSVTITILVLILSSKTLQSITLVVDGHNDMLQAQAKAEYVIF